MAPPNVEITIPTTTTSTTSPPYTIYNITLRLPLRSFTVKKRYSDFLAFHSTLVNQVGTAPPAPLPGKSWFTNTISNATYREERRQALEAYLRAINETSDLRWRSSSVWRAFLNLPSSAARDSASASRLHAAVTEPGGVTGGGGPITDPILWLDCYRDMKGHLHDARLHLTRRDQETTPQKQHESSAHAKSSLVKAGSLIVALEEGLNNLVGAADTTLGDGEVRRRKDLLVNARKEKDGLEDLLHAMAAKSRVDSTLASIQDKEALVGNGNGGAGGRKTPRSGRVLGKETERTRELDNQGLVQLQKQTMADQDLSVEELRKIVARQKELGIAINSELVIQNELLKLTDEDADRFAFLPLLSSTHARANGQLGYNARLTSRRGELERYLKWSSRQLFYLAFSYLVSRSFSSLFFIAGASVTHLRFSELSPYMVGYPFSAIMIWIHSSFKTKELSHFNSNSHIHIHIHSPWYPYSRIQEACTPRGDACYFADMN